MATERLGPRSLPVNPKEGEYIKCGKHCRHFRPLGEDGSGTCKCLWLGGRMPTREGALAHQVIRDSGNHMSSLKVGNGSVKCFERD